MSRFLARRTTPTVIAAPTSRRALIALYAIAAFLYWSSLYLYVPTLPTYIQTKTAQLAMVGVVLAQYGLWQAFIRVPLGITVDWLGWNKPFIIVGFALCGLGALILGLADDAGQLAAGRAITGLAAGTWVPLIVAFSGLFQPREAVRATALITFVGSSGRVLSTAVTGSLNELGGYSLSFLIAAGAAGLAILFILPAHARRRPPNRPSKGSIRRVTTRPDVLLPALLAAISQYANWAATFSFMPILARELGASDVTLSMLLSLHIGVAIAGNLVASVVVVRIGTRRLLYTSFGLMGAGLGLAALAPALALVFVAQVLMGLSQGIGYPVLMGMSIQYVDDAYRTTAMGLHQAVYAIGMFSGPWLSGVLADSIGIQSMFGVTALGTFILGAVITHWLAEA